MLSPKNLCRECGEPGRFPITPINDNGVTYVKDDIYYLCTDCFRELIKLVCPACASEDIIIEYHTDINELDVQDKAEKYCNNCGYVLGSPNKHSHKEIKDYKINPDDYQL